MNKFLQLNLMAVLFGCVSLASAAQPSESTVKNSTPELHVSHGTCQPTPDGCDATGVMHYHCIANKSTTEYKGSVTVKIGDQPSYTKPGLVIKPGFNLITDCVPKDGSYDAKVNIIYHLATLSDFEENYKFIKTVVPPYSDPYFSTITIPSK